MPALYEEHGRIRGGDPEEAVELACRAFLADHLAGKDSLLLARTAEQAREMSRRVRDDLLRYGLVRRAGEVQLRYQAIASQGDLIVARKNNRRIIAGTPGRWLTNRDVLRLEASTGRTVTVRRLAGRDTAGRPLWTAAFELPRTYLLRHCDLAYATTAHAAQGRTADTSHVLVDGLGDRQGLYVAMSRGRDGNYAYCITRIPRAADVRQGSLPAPELARLRKITREHAALEPEPRAAGEEETAPSRDAAAVLADVLRRDGTVFSATETLRGELANADHLGVLGSIWYDLIRRSQADRFEASLREVLPATDAEAALQRPGVHLAVADAPRSRISRAECRPGTPLSGELGAADRSAACGPGHRCADPPDARRPGTPAARVVVAAGTGGGRPGAAPLSNRTGRGDGRPCKTAR